MNDSISATSVEDRYLHLMKGALTRLLFSTNQFEEVWIGGSGWQVPVKRLLRATLAKRNMVIAKRFNQDARAFGRDWPDQAETMIGMERLNNLEECVKDVLRMKVPGDFIETGVWRGGACIFMRAILAAYGSMDRTVWVADSFEGLPKPNVSAYPADAGLDLYTYKELAVSVDEVKDNFRRYNLLDEQVQFLVGFFRDTLHAAPISQLAILRLDGDLYESTMDALTALYPKLAVGGYLIIDDYNIPACVKAVNDYRSDNTIKEEIESIDGMGVFWKRVSR